MHDRFVIDFDWHVRAGPGLKFIGRRVARRTTNMRTRRTGRENLRYVRTRDSTKL